MQRNDGKFLIVHENFQQYFQLSALDEYVHELGYPPIFQFQKRHKLIHKLEHTFY